MSSLRQRQTNLSIFLNIAVKHPLELWWRDWRWLLGIFFWSYISWPHSSRSHSTFKYFLVQILGNLGRNATLPCQLPSKRSNTDIQVKWIKLENDEAPFEDVLLSLGTQTKTFGRFENRVFLQNADSRDVSLVITDIVVEDMGQYRCEIINGTKHTAGEGFLKVQGCAIEGEML